MIYCLLIRIYWDKAITAKKVDVQKLVQEKGFESLDVFSRVVSHSSKYDVSIISSDGNGFYVFYATLYAEVVEIQDTMCSLFLRWF